jgi:hypothetical protein
VHPEEHQVAVEPHRNERRFEQRAPSSRANCLSIVAAQHLDGPRKGEGSGGTSQSRRAGST